MSEDKAVQALRRIAAIENMNFGADWEEIEEARLIAVEALREIDSKPARAPLTEEQIDALDLPSRGVMSVRDMVRIVERAHGIGEAG